MLFSKGKTLEGSGRQKRSYNKHDSHLSVQLSLVDKCLEKSLKKAEFGLELQGPVGKHLLYPCTFSGV